MVKQVGDCFVNDESSGDKVTIWRESFNGGRSENCSDYSGLRSLASWVAGRQHVPELRNGCTACAAEKHGLLDLTSNGVVVAGRRTSGGNSVPKMRWSVV